MDQVAVAGAVTATGVFGSALTECHAVLSEEEQMNISDNLSRANKRSR